MGGLQWSEKTNEINIKPVGKRQSFMSTESQNKVFTLLDEMHISFHVVHHPAVFTIQEMENLQVEHMDKVVKNLFIRDDKKRKYYLLVMQKDKSANLKELRYLIESRPLSFASEDDLSKYLGLSKGEVTPFGVLNDEDNIVTVIIDKDLTNYDFIGIHPNDNTATVFISVDDLVKILKVKRIEIMFIDL